MSDLRSLADDCRKFGEEWVRRSIPIVKRTVEQSASSTLGGDPMMSGARIKLGVKVRKQGASAFIIANPLGPWRWANEGTPVGGGKRRQGGSSPAKRSWDIGADRVGPLVTREADVVFAELGN